MGKEQKSGVESREKKKSEVKNNEKRREERGKEIEYMNFPKLLNREGLGMKRKGGER